ncbi:MAG: outer membrane beta-barrel protein [Pseudomonadota bacterium]
MRFAIFLLVLLTGNSFASEARFEITPQLGYTFGGTLADVNGADLDLDDATSVSLTVNIRVRADATVEVFYSHQDVDTNAPGFAVDPGVELGIQKLEFGGTYRFNDGYPKPYVAATVGVTKLDPDAQGLRDDSFFSFSLGGGVRLYETDRFAVRADARWLATVLSDDTDLLCESSGGVNCAVAIDADLLSQFRINLGLSLRF